MKKLKFEKVGKTLTKEEMKALKGGTDNQTFDVDTENRATHVWQRDPDK